MRKLLYAVYVLIIGLTSCSQEETLPSKEEIPPIIVEKLNYSLTVGTENDALTRSDSKPYSLPNTIPGFAARYLLEIYSLDENQQPILYHREASLNNTFDFRLIKEQTYHFLVWVDYIPQADPQTVADHYYQTSPLTDIRIDLGQYTNSFDGSRDAYFGSQISYVAMPNAAPIQVNCVLPFAQVKIYRESSNDPKITDLKFEFLTYTHFNVATGEPFGDLSDFSFPIVRQPLLIGVDQHLTRDFIFASKASVNTPTLLFSKDSSAPRIMKVKEGETDEKYIEISELPISRGKVTNVKITKPASSSVSFTHSIQNN